jgi:hypothetical protein
MNVCNIIVLIILYILSYIVNLYIIEYLSINNIYIYTSILSYIIIILGIDSFNLIKDNDYYNDENRNIHKLLELQIIENNKLKLYLKKDLK